MLLQVDKLSPFIKVETLVLNDSLGCRFLNEVRCDQNSEGEKKLAKLRKLASQNVWSETASPSFMLFIA